MIYPALSKETTFERQIQTGKQQDKRMVNQSNAEIQKYRLYLQMELKHPSKWYEHSKQNGLIESKKKLVIELPLICS